MGRKRRLNNMAWDYKRFRSRYQWENNPGVEPTRLFKNDDSIFLTYIHQDGTETYYTSLNFFEERLWNILPAISDGRMMAMDYEEFRNTFQQENNPDVDPYTLRKTTDYTPLIHINQYGVMIHYTPARFFSDRLWETITYRKPLYEMAMDYEEFRDTFQQENNPDVNPYTLRKWQDFTPLIHINQYGVVMHYSPQTFFNNRLWEIMPYRKPLYEMAMDYEEFRDTFQQENNPDVNPYTLRKWQDFTPLIHINRYGVKIHYTPNRFFSKRLWESMPFIKERKKEIKEEKKNKIDKRNTVYEMAMDYEEFREFFQQENNPGIDPYILKKWRDYTPLLHINKYGVETPYTPHYFFHKRIWEYVPYRQYKPGEIVNALALDEDITLYVKNEKERQKLTNTGVHTNKAFQCPFCGSEFTKKLSEMINCSPKCPFCNDTGIYKEADDEEINGAYLKRT